MVQICALASGSNGNSYYVGNKNEAVIVDAGIYHKRLMHRMQSANLEPKKVKAVFVSHEHGDHVCGLRVTSKRMNIPAISTKKTFHKLKRNSIPDLYSFFEPDVPYQINDIKVVPFLKNHDAIEPCSFIIHINGLCIGVMTDIGFANETLGKYIAQCDAIFLETNYDEKMLFEGSYPYFLKQRVASDFGHLSNIQARELIDMYASDKLKVLILSHLSAANNTPDLALDSFRNLNPEIKIYLSNRYDASEVINL